MKINIKSFAVDLSRSDQGLGLPIYGVFNKPVYVFGLLCKLDTGNFQRYYATFKDPENNIVYDNFNLRDASFNQSGSDLDRGRLSLNALFYPINSYLDFNKSFLYVSGLIEYMLVSYSYSSNG